MACCAACAKTDGTCDGYGLKGLRALGAVPYRLDYNETSDFVLKWHDLSAAMRRYMLLREPAWGITLLDEDTGRTYSVWYAPSGVLYIHDVSDMPRFVEEVNSPLPDVPSVLDTLEDMASTAVDYMQIGGAILLAVGVWEVYKAYGAGARA